MRYHFLLWALFAFSSVSLAQAFRLVGTTKGMPNGTWLYLRDGSKDADIDSVQIQNSRFEMKGVMEVPQDRWVLHTAGFRQYKIFWLEPGTTTITMVSNKLRDARVEGSEMASDEEKYRKILAPIQDQMEQLEAAIEKEKNESRRNRLMARYEQKNKEEQAATQLFVQQHPQALYSAYLLSVYSKQWGANKTRSLFAGMMPGLQHTSFGQKISRYLSVARELAVDSLFAEVAAPDTSGVIRTLSEQKGKWTLLEFWASWCGPCREANPALRQLYADLRMHSFEIFAVSLDKDATAWKKAIVADRLPWLHVSQLKGFDDDAALTYSVTGIPDNVLIAPDGKIAGRDLAPDQIKKKVLGPARQ
jgi:thiol-disulfide isomerase/thioredoxin